MNQSNQPTHAVNEHFGFLDAYAKELFDCTYGEYKTKLQAFNAKIKYLLRQSNTIVSDVDDATKLQDLSEHINDKISRLRLPAFFTPRYMPSKPMAEVVITDSMKKWLEHCRNEDFAKNEIVFTWAVGVVTKKTVKDFNEAKNVYRIQNGSTKTAVQNKIRLEIASGFIEEVIDVIKEITAHLKGNVIYVENTKFTLNINPNKATLLNNMDIDFSKTSYHTIPVLHTKVTEDVPNTRGTEPVENTIESNSKSSAVH